MDFQRKFAGDLQMTIMDSLTVEDEWLQFTYGPDVYDRSLRLRRALREAEEVSLEAGYPFRERLGNMLYPDPAHAPPLFERVMEAIQRGAAAEESWPMLV